MALLILAGLQVIHGDVYESAMVDGRTAWQRFVHIALPLVKPALLVAILFRTRRPADVRPPGHHDAGANNTTTLLILVVQEIRSGKYNSGSALSTITFIVIFLVSLIFVKLLGINAVETTTVSGKGKA